MRLTPKANQTTGFTLVEIMIVILILAMLLAIIVPYYVKQRATAQANICVNNLFKIETASYQFALEKGRKTGDPVDFPDDLKPYLKLTRTGQIPPCPAGGTYAIANIGTEPTCSLGNSVDPVHVLP